MYTLGFRFKPYTSEQAIADAPAILNYLKEAAAENGIDKHMRFGQNVVAADWSDAAAGPAPHAGGSRCASRPGAFRVVRQEGA
jgi:cation diffusion facilitator CzcD-associated flavoprotein CzcO